MYGIPSRVQAHPEFAPRGRAVVQLCTRTERMATPHAQAPETCRVSQRHAHSQSQVTCDGGGRRPARNGLEGDR